MRLDLSAPVDATDHTRGVTGGHQLVVYGDFECPYTAAAMRDIGRLVGDGAAFEVVFRYFPLREIHPHAQAAAEAAEAAARQDRFWEMHDVLFRNQLRLEADDLRRYSERVGVDLDQQPVGTDAAAAIAESTSEGRQIIDVRMEGAPRHLVDDLLQCGDGCAPGEIGALRGGELGAGGDHRDRLEALDCPDATDGME